MINSNIGCVKSYNSGFAHLFIFGGNHGRKKKTNKGGCSCRHGLQRL
nr:MAG TPA: hypothetical protein [Caudoviricetes sp.]